ncbi:MAG: TIGR-Tas system RNA-guided endonuclease, partial [Candidatus Methanospirareceae archaeon]
EGGVTKMISENLRKRIRMTYELLNDIQGVRLKMQARERALGKADICIEVKELQELERRLQRSLKEMIKDLPIYREFLSNIPGIGIVSSAGLIAYFDPHKAQHISSFWKRAGLHVVNGKAARRTAGQKSDFNPKIKSFVLYRIGMNFLRVKTPYYSDLYEKYKQLENEKLNNPIENPKNCPYYEECRKKTNKTPACKMHVHLRALRRMVKRFLADLWIVWRKLEGLPITKPYAVEKLGHHMEVSPYVERFVKG